MLNIFVIPTVVLGTEAYYTLGLDLENKGRGGFITEFVLAFHRHHMWIVFIPFDLSNSTFFLRQNMYGGVMTYSIGAMYTGTIMI